MKGKGRRDSGPPGGEGDKWLALLVGVCMVRPEYKWLELVREVRAAAREMRHGAKRENIREINPTFIQPAKGRGRTAGRRGCDDKLTTFKCLLGGRERRKVASRTKRKIRLVSGKGKVT